MMWQKNYPKTVSKHDFCYRCSIGDPGLLFGGLLVKDKIDEPFFPM